VLAEDSPGRVVRCGLVLTMAPFWYRPLSESVAVLHANN
jgi:hypothetical protein